MKLYGNWKRLDLVAYKSSTQRVIRTLQASGVSITRASALTSDGSDGSVRMWLSASSHEAAAYWHSILEARQEAQDALCVA